MKRITTQQRLIGRKFVAIHRKDAQEGDWKPSDVSLRQIDKETAACLRKGKHPVGKSNDIEKNGAVWHLLREVE